MKKTAGLLTILFLCGWIGLRAVEESAPIPDAALIRQLEFRYIGPRGNRVIAVIGDPGRREVYYAGAASGGIFKTEDGGVKWRPIFDSQNVSSVSALALAPSDPSILWAGTGETFIRSNISVGDGIYKSVDGGESWKRMGLEQSGRIGRIVIHPYQPDIVYAAVLGHGYGPQKERGVFRTENGGKSWRRVLFVNAYTGCSDIALSPENPRLLAAGMWRLEMNTWRRNSGGEGSGVHISRDGGDTWEQITEKHGLPKPPLGKIGVAFAPSDANKIYALIETPQFDFAGVLWRSDNGGASWSLISYNQEYTQRPHYYSRCAVSPNDADEVYFLAHGVWKSRDGGKNADIMIGIGGDDHDMWIDPNNPDRMIVGNDAGVAISVNRGKSWSLPPLPIAQMYHVATDNRIPYYVCGNLQDGPSVRGPSNTLTGGSIPVNLWHTVGGGECGFTIVDPQDNNIIWSSNYDGYLTRYDLRTGHFRNVTVWPDEPMGWPPTHLKYRWNWTFPFILSPHDPAVIYAGSQYVHTSNDGGHSWKVISPDLTTNDKTRQVSSGGLTIDNIGVDYGCTLFSLAESPVEKGVIWAGSNDGLTHVTRNGGQNWQPVTAQIKGMPVWGTVSNIEPSRFHGGTCYISVDAHQENDRRPYIFKTTDYGKTWEIISRGIPAGMFSYVHCVREDPGRAGMLYAGTENAIYFTYDDGGRWMPLKNNLPPAPVHWLTIQEHFSDLVVGTYGRGFWILDDITPLRALTPEILAAEGYLFEPRPAYRFQPGREYITEPTPADGKNPPYGAVIHFFWKEKPLRENSAEIHILDSQGKSVRKLNVTIDRGINRIYWDLRFQRALEPRLRTAPLGYPGEGYGPERLRYGTVGWRPLIDWGYGGFIGPLVPPGRYSVMLKMKDRSWTQNLEIRKDPNSSGSEADIRSQTALSLEIRDSISDIARMVNALEWIRRQLDHLAPMLREYEGGEPFLEQVEQLDKKCINIEKEFFQLTMTGTFADDLRGPTMLYSKLMNLNYGVQTGDFPPTVQQREVFALLKSQVEAQHRAFEKLLTEDVAEFNKTLRVAGILSVIVPRKDVNE